MKTQYGKTLLALLAVMAGVLQLHAQGTAFTYQGRLDNGGNPANGIYDLTFTVYPAVTGGSANGAVTNTGVAVSGGLFTTTLDFHGIPDGSPAWIELGVRTNGAGMFAPLTPRQALAPTPYAMFANTASNLAGSLAASQLSGLLTPAQLPASMVTNGGSGLVLAGTFSGDGNGLTSLNAAQLTGTILLARLPANVLINGGTGGYATGIYSTALGHYTTASG